LNQNLFLKSFYQKIEIIVEKYEKTNILITTPKWQSSLQTIVADLGLCYSKANSPNESP